MRRLQFLPISGDGGTPETMRRQPAPSTDTAWGPRFVRQGGPLSQLVERLPRAQALPVRIRVTAAGKRRGQ